MSGLIGLVAAWLTYRAAESKGFRRPLAWAVGAFVVVGLVAYEVIYWGQA